MRPGLIVVSSVLGLCGCGTDSKCVGYVGDPAQCRTTNAYVTPDAPSSGPCSQSAPCSLFWALSFCFPRGEVETVHIAAGTYDRFGSVEKCALIGSGASQTILMNSAMGDVLQTADTVEIDDVTIQGSPTGDGNGIDASGPLTLMRDVVTQNQRAGLTAQNTVSISQTVFSMNGTGADLSLADTIGIDSSAFLENGAGLVLSGGNVTNTFVFRNSGTGATLGGRVTFDFNTVADNGAQDVACKPNALVAATNNIVVGGGVGPNPGCYFTNTYPQDSPMGGPIGFVSTMPPYDYHLAAGSIAIDAATACSVDHDFDGDHRPTGPACDVGADEAQ